MQIKYYILFYLLF